MTATFRLLDDFQARYLKFKGREPRTLEELAIAKAESDHCRRLAEIKVLRNKLSMLDEFVPALAERSIKLSYRNLSTWDGGKTIRIQEPTLERDNKLHAALLELGFKETERKHSYRDEFNVTLQHGRWLAVSITIRDAAPAAPTTPPAVA